MATKKITKAMRFTDIKALLSGESAPHGTTIEEALAVLDNELTLLAKKNTNTNKKATETQKLNAELKDKIVEYLGTLEEGATCTEIIKSGADFSEYSNQKIASLMRQLKADGLVESNVVKGKTKFFLA